MKQKYLIATLAAGMLVLAGCGGGNGVSIQIPQAERTCAPGTMESADGTQCVPDPDHMSPADMAAVAAKLHAGIGSPGAAGANGAGVATYTGEGNADISVTPVISDTDGNPTDGTAVTLMEDKDTMVADLHGWKGQRFYLEPPGNAGTYEAHVYSNIGEPTQGKKFASAAAVTPTGEYEYQLNADMRVAVDPEPANTGRIASPSFDQSAGTKTFELPDNNVAVMISGTYHGVSGTYHCVPTGGGTDCSAAVAASGFTLAGGTWTFKADSNEARVTSTPATFYATYGWWFFNNPNGQDLASSFYDPFGGDPSPGDYSTLSGTATYSGGAAGKYALSSSTGGINDAGNFTADARFDVTFGGTHTISGAIDNFTDGNGESKAWSVELKETTLANTGDISSAGTEWTIGGTAADASGQWQGFMLGDLDESGLPKEGFGTFYSEYGSEGKIVGGFGVTLDK